MKSVSYDEMLDRVAPLLREGATYKSAVAFTTDNRLVVSGEWRLGKDLLATSLEVGSGDNQKNLYLIF